MKTRKRKSRRSLDRIVRRPPCAVMSITAAVACDSKIPRALAKAGYEIVIVADADVDKTIKMVERIRRVPPNEKLGGPAGQR